MTLLEKIEVMEEVARRVGGKMVDDYSGRHMYGATCCAIECDSYLEAVEEAAELGLKGGVIDQLGKGYIVYWPSIRRKS